MTLNTTKVPDSSAHDRKFPQVRISEKIHKLTEQLPPDEINRIRSENEAIAKSRSELEEHVRKLFLAEGPWYDFNDYEDRLLLSDEEIDRIIQEYALEDNGSSNMLGRSFSDYIQRISRSNHPDDIERNSRKLIRELRLDDWARERSESFFSKSYWNHETIKFHSIDEFLDELRSCTSLVKRWAFSQIFGNLDRRGYMEIVKIAGEIGIRDLNLARTDICDVLGGEGVVKFVRQASASGVKKLDFSGCRFGSKLSSEEILEIAKACTNGVKCLGLQAGELGNRLDTENFLNFIQEAGRSGVRSLELYENGLENQLEEEDFITLVRVAGESGVRHLGIGHNIPYYSKIYTRLVQIAGQSGIRSIGLQHSLFDFSFEAMPFMDQIVKSGIRKIEMYNSNLSHVQIRYMEDMALEHGIRILT